MIKVRLLNYTPDPERTVAAAAKLCYSTDGVDAVLDGLTPEKTESFLKMLDSVGHQSPIEHASFTFGIEGVSRSFLAQITRHRIASYSVKSQRYVPEDDFDYVVPPQIAADEEALKIYEETMADIANAYKKLAAILKDNNTKRLVSEGTDPDKAARAAEKTAIEDARFVLPNACETQMVVTMNARSLFNFFNLRCCNRAQWEIREVAYQMLSLVYKAAPTLFAKAGAPCVSGLCTEGKMSCGRADEVRRYTALRKERALSETDCD